MRKIYSMLVIIFFGVPIFQEIHACEIKAKSFDIEKYEIVMFSNQIILKLSIVPSIDGNFKYFIHAPNQMKKESIQYKDSSYNINMNTQNSGIWETLKNGDRLWRIRIVCPEAYYFSVSTVVTTNATYLINQENGKYQKGVKS